MKDPYCMSLKVKRLVMSSLSVPWGSNSFREQYTFWGNVWFLPFGSVPK